MTLADKRAQIDLIDGEIIRLLDLRFSLVSSLLLLKEDLADPAREQEILAKISSKYSRQIYQAIFQTAKELLLDQGFSKNQTAKKEL